MIQSYAELFSTWKIKVEDMQKMWLSQEQIMNVIGNAQWWEWEWSLHS